MYLDMSNPNDLTEAITEISGIATAFNRAVTTGCLVELRVEDLPNMNMDFILKTKLSKVMIDLQAKLLKIEADELSLMYQYEKCFDGSSSAGHDKFYFQTKDKISLTITVTYNNV